MCSSIVYTRRGDSAPCPGLVASACACAAPKWCGGNSTHSHHIFTPSIAGRMPPVLRRSIGRVMSSRSRAEGESPPILGVTMWWECVEFPPHHFGAAQAHALASRPGHGAESPRRVSCCTLHHSSNIIVSRVGGSLEGNNRRTHVVGVCTILATPLSSRASACTCD